MTFSVHCDVSNNCFNFCPVAPVLQRASFSVLLFEMNICVTLQNCQISANRFVKGTLPLFSGCLFISHP